MENVPYDMIIGRDLLECLKMDIKYSTSTMIWDDAEIPMKSTEAKIEDSFHVNDSPSLEEAANRIKQILDAKYEPANLDEVTDTVAVHI